MHGTYEPFASAGENENVGVLVDIIGGVDVMSVNGVTGAIEFAEPVVVPAMARVIDCPSHTGGSHLIETWVAERFVIEMFGAIAIGSRLLD
jgi:hypothetical protein